MPVSTPRNDRQQTAPLDEAAPPFGDEWIREPVERTSDFVAVLDCSGNVKYISPAVTRVLGYRPDELLGRAYRALIHPDDMAWTARQAPAPQRGPAPVDAARRFRHSDGTWRELETLSCTRLAFPPLEGTVVIMRDVTDRDRFPGRPPLPEDGCRLVFEQASDGILVADRDGRPIEINEAGCSLLGYTRDEILSGQAWNLIHDHDPEITPVRTEDMRAEKATVRDCRLGRKDGTCLLNVQEQERANISRELHAEIGQALTALVLRLQEARQGEYANVALLDECIGIAKTTLDQARDLSLSLRPPHLDHLGLEEALKWLLQRQAEAAGWHPAIVGAPLSIRLAPEIETACFRIAQEALTNAARHANARNVEVRLRVAGGELELVVRDDGRGFNPDAVHPRDGERTSLGLVSMGERAALAGGTVAIGRPEEGGTEIIAKFPLV